MTLCILLSIISSRSLKLCEVYAGAIIAAGLLASHTHRRKEKDNGGSLPREFNGTFGTIQMPYRLINFPTTKPLSNNVFGRLSLYPPTHLLTNPSNHRSVNGDQTLLRRPNDNESILSWWNYVRAIKSEFTVHSRNSEISFLLSS